LSGTAFRPRCCPPPSAAPRQPPSCPTRRSSDLSRRATIPTDGWTGKSAGKGSSGCMDSFELNKVLGGLLGTVFVVFSIGLVSDRSEEHTSELQSREKLVCRLLLEKKNPPPATTE